MNKFTGGFTTPNFKISATLGIIVVAEQIVRQETVVSTVLGTPEGVERWLADFQPYVSVKVTELQSGKDVSSEFTKGLQFIKSRHGNPPQVVDWNKV